MRALRFGPAAAVLLWSGLAAADQGKGTLADPIRVDALPYAIKGDTSKSASSDIDFYDCAPATDETGPELVYRFDLPEDARVTAWVSGDTDVVDIDVQLLDDLDVQGGVANGCLSRNNRIAEANLSAGTHYVVVDSFQGAAQAGPFVLHLDAIGDAWTERQIADGVVWRARRYQDQSGGPQVVHGLVIDTQAPGVDVRAMKSNGCQTVGEMASAAGAIAAINGGYFNVMTCDPVSLLKSNGMLLATNGTKRGAFGLDAAGAPAIEVINAGADWPGIDEAHGGGPTLAVAGVAKSGAAAWSAEGFSSAGFIGVNPRTFAGIDAAGKVLFGTVDGRRDNAAGMSLDGLAAYAVSDEFGAVDAVNLDGGGSTTMWVKGATYNGVVNYPSDEPNQELSTHPGSRGVSGGFFVFAPPYNHAPRFQTEPPTAAAVGQVYTYDADALDLDVDDVLTFGLADSPPGMTVDPATGEVDFTPQAGTPALVDVTLTVSDDNGALSAQSFTLVVEGGGGTGTGGGGAGTGAGGGGGAGTGAGGFGGNGGMEPTGGASSGEGGSYGGTGGGGLDGIPGQARCSCRVPGDGGAGSGGAAAFVLMVAALVSRRRRALVSRS